MKSSISSATEFIYPGLKLMIRKSILLRERAVADGCIIYLSLLDEEIDERLEKFQQVTVKATSQWLDSLELTDAVIHIRRDREVIVYRGGSCTFPFYWSHIDKQLHISTQLPIAEHRNFSRKNLVSYFTNICLQSAYEPNSITNTPLANWRRIRRGAKTTFSDGHFIRDEIHLHQVGKVLSEEIVAEHVQQAFKAYGLSQQHGKSSVLELSGGFDSTLAAAASPSLLSKMQGVSVEFPYYEFRFEADTQKAVGTDLGIDRFVFDGTDEFPYSPAHQIPLFDEPTVFVTGLRHAERVAGFASNSNASYLYIGHGGDQLFSTDLLVKDPVSPLQMERGLFSGYAANNMKSTYIEIKNSPWLQRSTGCFVYDACIDVWMKEAYALTVRTPFTDLSMFKAALEWSQWCKKYSARPDKSILSKSMAKVIPDTVLKRKGKVAYDGVWLRGYIKHAEYISGKFEQTADILEYIGISPRWLLHRVKQITELQSVSASEIIASYSISHWLSSWNINSLKDVTWID